MNNKDLIAITKSKVKGELLSWNQKRPFISISELAEALHIGRDSARSCVRGLDYIPHGKRKDYLIDDIAERIAEMRESSGGAA